MPTLLLVSAFAVATCGLVYELLAGTLASYLLGDSVTQFSTIIGTYLFAMGAGSWATRFLGRDLLQAFARIEVIVGVLGGCSTLLLFWLYGEVVHFRVALYGTVFLIGALVGAEIPLLLRILNSEFDFKEVIARVRGRLRRRAAGLVAVPAAAGAADRARAHRLPLRGDQRHGRDRAPVAAAAGTRTV